MSRFLIFVVVTLALGFGNEGMAGLEEPSDDAEANNEIPVKRTTYLPIRSAAAHPDVCFFLQQGGADGRIACRLRFTRSKFNFNPFGLRFGKREENGARKSAAGGRYVISDLLKDRRAPPCRRDRDHRCQRRPPSLLG